MALVILLEKITEALDNSQFGICILIDFRKAFDTVEHNILLEKLYHYGIRGNALQIDTSMSTITTLLLIWNLLHVGYRKDLS